MDGNNINPLIASILYFRLIISNTNNIKAKEMIL